MRLSLTDKCNLRCTYCMPAEGLEWLAKQAVMSAEEIVRIVRIGVDMLGVRELRLTGGEPLVRADLLDIISALRQAHPELPISMTTNAVGLDKKAAGAQGCRTLPDQRFAGFPARRDLHQAHPPPVPGQGPGRSGRRLGRGSGSRETQRRPDAGNQRRRVPVPAGLGAGPRLRTPLHRADAARRRPRLDPPEHDHRG